MTREEAIKTLKENYCAMCSYGSQDMDSCDIHSCDNKDAIKALEKEPCEDAISRQAAIDAINRLSTHKFAYEIKTGWIVRGDAVNKLRRLPSVNPQPKTGHWIPVSERLPNSDEYKMNNGLFNVSDGNRSYSEWFDIYDKQMFGEPTMSGFRVDRCVTAWMPLPKPYEKQEREDKE